MKEKVEAALNKIRPMLQADGGNVELVEVTPDGVVKVRLTGWLRLSLRVPAGGVR